MGGPLRVTLEWKGGGWPSKGHIGVEGGWPSKGHIGVEMGVGNPLLCLCVQELYEDRSVEIGAGYTGISVYYETKLVGRTFAAAAQHPLTNLYPPPPQATDYPWPIINKLLYHGRRFKIRYHPEDDLEHWEIKKHKFNATETRWSKRIWKECVEQHTFFRLAVPGEPPLPIPQFIPQLGRNSKLRFSGRTLAQMRLHNKPSPGVSFPRWVDSR